jgi:hypothetical protein
MIRLQSVTSQYRFVIIIVKKGSIVGACRRIEAVESHFEGRRVAIYIIRRKLA